MVATTAQAQAHSIQLLKQDAIDRADSAERSGCVQPIGNLMAEVLARYLPAEDVWQERSRIALKTVSAAAG